MSGTFSVAEAVYRPLAWVPVWVRNLRVWRGHAGAALLNHFGEPVLYLLGLGYGLGGFIGSIDGLPYVIYLASGIVCSSAMMTSSFEAMYSAYTRMRVQRTWEAMLAAPLDVHHVVVGEAIWAASKALISATAILLVGSLLGAVHGWAALWAVPVVLLTGLAFASLALIVTVVARTYEVFLYYNTLVLTPMLLLSGVFFPLERMPEVVSQGAHLLPLVHAVEVIRPLMIGQPLESPGTHLAVLAGYAAVSLAIAIRLARRRLAG